MGEKRHLPLIPPEQYDSRVPNGAFSNSQYELYKACGRAYEFKYVKGVKNPPGSAMVRGVALHHGVEVALKAKKEGHPITLDEQLATTSDRFDELKSEVGDWGGEEPGAIKTAALVLAKLYHQQALPKINPVEVEQPFIRKVGNVTVRGVIDLIDMAKESPSDPGLLVVADLKTSAAKWSANEVAADAQLTLYSGVTGLPNVRIDNLVLTKTPAYHRLSTTRVKNDTRNLVEDYEQVVDAISKGVFLMAPMDSWKCTPKWCAYWSMCRGRP